MIQLELINEELCASCGKCCKKYYNTLQESRYVEKKEGDFFENAFEQFGVTPLRNPSIEANDYCEFYDASLGCIIERERRPLQCRIHFCDNLYMNANEFRKFEVTEKIKEMRAIQFVIDPSGNKLIISYDDLDLEEFKEAVDHRINACLNCEYHRYGSDVLVLVCGKCRCGIFNKIYRKYPLDKDGKVIASLFATKNTLSACPLRKW